MKKLLSFWFLVAMVVVASCSDDDMSVAPSLNNGSTSGTGGSLARFTISGNKLYVVDQTSLRTFDVSTATDPKPATTIPIGLGIETVFPYGNNLFIGAADAMYIFDISNPAQPRQISRYDHFVGCDPVVVQGNYAYVTLRTTGCRPGFNGNVLDVIDLTDLNQPRLVNTLQMFGPYGLGVRGNALFVCEGDKGLRVFDVTEPQSPVEKSFVSDIKTYDVIPLPQSLLVTGEDGFRQYDYSDLTELKLLSKIDVAKN
jgi:hypothetical protein